MTVEAPTTNVVGWTVSTDDLESISGFVINIWQLKFIYYKDRVAEDFCQLIID